LTERRTEGNDMVRKYILETTGKFASYMKHKERGKLERRATASANMGLRMFLHIIKEFHLALGKEINGSTISRGGEEKKTKILNNFNAASLTGIQAEYVSQGTEDATKWNECLAPSAYALLHHTFFDDVSRIKLDIPLSNENGKILQKMLSGNYIMATKTIQLGPGVMISNEKYFRRIQWDDDDDDDIKHK
jgi:hypothetical protein